MEVRGHDGTTRPTFVSPTMPCRSALTALRTGPRRAAGTGAAWSPCGRAECRQCRAREPPRRRRRGPAAARQSWRGDRASILRLHGLIAAWEFCRPRVRIFPLPFPAVSPVRSGTFGFKPSGHSRLKLLRFADRMVIHLNSKLQPYNRSPFVYALALSGKAYRAVQHRQHLAQCG